MCLAPWGWKFKKSASHPAGQTARDFHLYFFTLASLGSPLTGIDWLSVSFSENLDLKFFFFFLTCVGRHATWSQSRSCSWLHYVYWTDDHRMAEPHQQPMKHNINAHKSMENDGHLFARTAVRTHKHNLRRCLLKKGENGLKWNWLGV